MGKSSPVTRDRSQIGVISTPTLSPTVTRILLRTMWRGS
jgi:hypothetical protein